MNNAHKHFFEEHSHWGTLVARVGIAAVFLWFGIDKFIHPIEWAGWVPDWMTALIPMSLVSFMYIQGAIETVVGALLLIGYQTRFAALLAVVTLCGVILAMIGTGSTDVLLRDVGLLAASISLLFTGSDCMSIDCRLKK